MKTCKSVTFVPASKLCIAFFLAAAMETALAQINTNDPSLVLWLQANTISSADLSGPGVTNWTDSSSYGTILVPPLPLPPGDTGNDPSNHEPQLITVTNNGVAFNAVEFREAYDPITPDPTYGHFADRLWQTNNQGANDPLEIYPSNDITWFVVEQDNAPNGALGPDQTIFAKRGPGACPYEFGLNIGLSISTAGTGPDHMFVTYGGSVAYSPTPPVPSQPEWNLVEMNLTSGGTLTFKEYYASLGGWRTSTMTGVARGSALPGDAPFEIGFHTQGAGGTAADPWGNGAYERWAGNIAELMIYNRSLSSNEEANVENYLLAKYFLAPGAPSITTQPKSQQVNEFDPVTFSVLPDGTPPFTYQWLKGGSPISGENGSSYTIPSVTTNDAGIYSVVVSNSVGFTNSQEAFLTVIPETNPPTVISALLDYTNNTSVTVAFSELVDPASATNISNYSINNSVAVTGATAVPQTTNVYWSNYIQSVVLTTTPITSESTLTVNGVQNRGGVPATNAQSVILVPGPAGTPPTNNLLMWLEADNGVLADNTGVYQWTDQSGIPNDHNALYSSGNAQLGQVPFPNGIHPVVGFGGSAALAVDNSADFEVQNLSIYLVGDVDNTKLAHDFIADWEGWVLGGSDNTPGAEKWSTWGNNGSGGGYYPIDPSSVILGNRVPTLISGTFANPGSQSLYFNTVKVGNLPNTVPIDYSAAAGVTVGALNPGVAQPLFGDIAEILVYTNVSPSQDAAVQSYLAGKYFTPSTVLPRLVSATLNATNNSSLTVVFSGPLSAATATNLSNYAINQGVTVSSVAIANQPVVNHAISPTTVVLTTSAINPGATYTLTVNGVSDWAGNAIATNSQIAISGIPAPRINIAPPAPDGTLTISWNDATATLQSADFITGPWTNMTGVASPYTVTPKQAQKFYRLKQ